MILFTYIVPRYISSLFKSEALLLFLGGMHCKQYSKKIAVSKILTEEGIGFSCCLECACVDVNFLQDFF